MLRTGRILASAVVGISFGWCANVRGTEQGAAPVSIADAIGIWATASDESRQRILATVVGGLSQPSAVNQLLSEMRAASRKHDPRLGATFALELADAARSVPGTTHRIVTDDLSPSLQFLKAAWPMVDHRDVDPEWRQAWYRAAIALWQGPSSLRRVPREHDGDWPAGWFGIEDVVRHARRRVPGELEFEMAWGLLHEQRLHYYAYTRAAVRTAWSTIPAIPVPKDGLVVFMRPGLDDVVESRREDLEQANRAYTRVIREAVGPLRSVGLLHMGSLEAYRGRTESAEQYWRDAGATSHDVDVQYLAVLFTARLHWNAGRMDSAVPLLLRARALRPQAQSAATMLMSIEFLSGNRFAATQIAVDVTTPVGTGDDPWVRYLRGSHAEWPARLSHLRSRLQR